MSAEAERAETLDAKKAENGGPEGSSRVSFIKNNWSTGLKILELILTIFCIGLAVDPLNYARLPQNNIHHVAVIYTAFSGYIIINSVLVLGGLAGERMGWKTSVLFSLIGVVIFTAAGGVIIYDWSKYMYNHIFHPSKQYMDMLISSGVFAIFNAFVYLVDAILTYREEP